MSERMWRGPRELRSLATSAAPEFPDEADVPPELTRRGLLQLLGASAALAGASGCSRGPDDSIVPYVNQPRDVTPSVPSKYATTMVIGGYGIGMVVESHEGRPTKAEGNPRHPASLGALGTLEQAAILSLYDPARARALTHAGEVATWTAFVDATSAAPPEHRRIHVLAEPTSAPHVIDLVGRVRRLGVTVHFDAPVARTNVWAGAKLAFGRVLEPRWDFSRADVVLALDADFLAATATPMAWARAWAQRRRLQSAADAMSRLYVVEPRLSVTGMAADERLPLRAREVRDVAAEVLAELLDVPGPVPGASESARRAASARPPSAHAAWSRAVARDLRAHAGASIVVAGDGQPPEVHALAHAMNEVLGNVGTTVSHAPSPIFEAGERSHDVNELLSAIDAGEVATLIVAGGDPAYTASPDREFARRLRSVPTTAYLGGRETATAALCTWFVPETHFLEAWGDARAFDGTVSIAQPLVRPLYETKSVAQVLAALAGLGSATTRKLVEDYWRANAVGDFEEFWRRALVTGIVGEAPGAPPVNGLLVDWAPIARELASPPQETPSLEVVFFPDAKVYDGQFGDNAWLQELADPVTKLTWDNAALVSPAAAARAKLETSDVVDLVVRGRSVRAPVLVLPGTAEGVVALALGYGQTVPDRLSHDVGANAYRVRD